MKAAMKYPGGKWSIASWIIHENSKKREELRMNFKPTVQISLFG